MLPHHHLSLDAIACGRSLLGWLHKKCTSSRKVWNSNHTHSSSAGTSVDEARGFLQFQGQTSSKYCFRDSYFKHHRNTCLSKSTAMLLEWLPIDNLVGVLSLTIHRQQAGCLLWGSHEPFLYDLCGRMVMWKDKITFLLHRGYERVLGLSQQCWEIAPEGVGQGVLLEMASFPLETYFRRCLGGGGSQHELLCCQCGWLIW